MTLQRCRKGQLHRVVPFTEVPFTDPGENAGPNPWASAMQSAGKQPKYEAHALGPKSVESTRVRSTVGISETKYCGKAGNSPAIAAVTDKSE